MVRKNTPVFSRERITDTRGFAEIRTPLNILCGMADELQADGETRPDGSTDLVLLRSASLWLLAHANNTLDVCSLELGAVRIERLPFNPRRYE
jgi:hypothetical protein